MIPLWSPDELVEATAGRLTTSFAATGVSIDTRSLQPGDLFIALVGETGDGHDHVHDAMAKGAAGAMVHRDVAGSAPLLQVDDTLAALARLGGYARARFGGCVVAVTGSVGKTTTKEMLRSILSAFAPTHAAVASYNNHWGLPLTLARMPRDAVFCVVEIGMNHPGEIAPLARLARPHVAVITGVEKAHIGYLGSLEAIADEKASLFHGLEPGGTAVLPVDSPLLNRLRARTGGARVVTFGEASIADVRLIEAQADADGSQVVAQAGGHTIRFRLNAPGRHMVLNALAALAAATAIVETAGSDFSEPAATVAERAARALEAFTPVTGRGARRLIRVPGGSALLLDESYNGNGASMRAALSVLRLQPARRRVAVLGDMLELGDAGSDEHSALSGPVIDAADRLFTCGPLMQRLFQAVPETLRAGHAADSAALAPIVAQQIAAGDAVLVKGSLGSRMKIIVNALDALDAEMR